MKAVLRGLGIRRAVAGSLVMLMALCASAPVLAQNQGAAPAAPMRAAGTVQVAFTPWDDAEALIVQTIAEARHQVLVQAYSFTSRAIATALIAARQRGVDVRVLADREQLFSSDNSRIPELVAAHIPVWLEVRYLSAHNKLMILDAGWPEQAVIGGSYNWTQAAQHRNAENVMVFRGHAELTRAYLANWERHRRDALPYAGARSGG